MIMIRVSKDSKVTLESLDCTDERESPARLVESVAKVELVYLEEMVLTVSKEIPDSLDISALLA